MNSAIIGSVALKVMLNRCRSTWAPNNLNIATPHNGLQVFSTILWSLGYQLNNMGIKRNEATSTLTHSEYINLDNKIITITEVKELDSFLSIILRSNHTTSMNFITSNLCCALYPVQSLKEQATYAYWYPPGPVDTSKIELRNFAVIMNSINHPINPALCCLNVQHQFTNHSGVGLFEWNPHPSRENILLRSYTWQLGDICLHRSCRIKRISHLLVRRNSRTTES